MMSKPPQSFVDSYATIGRKMRQYNTRSVSLLDSAAIISNTNNSYRSSVERNDSNIGMSR
jgi:hypothetical protein